MNSAPKRILTAALALSLALGSLPLVGIRSALADDPAGEPSELTAPIETMDPADSVDPIDVPAHDHVYADGTCTICGKPVAWDTNYVDEDHRGIYFYAVDGNGDVAYQFTDEQLAQVAIISSMTRLDNPDYRYEFGLSSMNVGVTTLYWYDVIADQISKFTAKYDQLDCILSMDNENHVPQLTDVVGGRAEVRLISEFDEETGTYSPLSVNGNPLFELDFYLNLAEPGPVPDPIQTMDSRSAGFTINLYDYTATAEKTAGAEGADGGINEISDLQFFDNADPSTADSSAESNAISEAAVARQGIVEPELGDDGYPALTEFDGSSLDVLFDTADVDGAKDVYADVNHLFKEEDGYYVYSSNDNYAYYDTAQGGGGNFAVLGSTYNQARQTDTALIDSGVPIGFFPLNAYNDLANNLAEASEDELTHSTGMSVDASFTLPASGKLDGEALTFEYTGDDDAWLFIDGVLVLDAGGIHANLNATVDFSTGAVTVGNASAIEAAGRTIGRGSTLKQIFEDAGKEWKTEGEHTLKFYSLERDGKQSDLTIKTNLYKVTDAKVTDVVVTKEWVDESGRPCDPWADSVTVQLYQTVDGETTPVDGATLELSADNDWTGAFESVPTTDEDGNDITYSVLEEAQDGIFPTYEIGGQTLQSKVYWVLYDASDGVEPGLYAILSGYQSDGSSDQAVLLTSVGQDKEVTYQDTFFVNDDIKDGKTGETYTQYINPVNDAQIWTISQTQPQTFVTREPAEGLKTDENGYTLAKTTPSSGFASPMAATPYEFYVKDDRVYTKGDDGSYSEVEGTVYAYSSGTAWSINTNVNFTPRIKQEADENGYALYYRYANTGSGYGWDIYCVKDNQVYKRSGSSYTSSSVSLSQLSPLNAVSHEDGYVVLYQVGMSTGKYYTTDNWDGVYRKNSDGTYTKLSQYDGYVPTNFQANVSAEMEDGYYVTDGSDGNVYYFDPATPTVRFRKTADGSYEPVPNGSIVVYAVQNYTETESDDYRWQIANKGMNLTLVGPGQQWMDYTYITSNAGTRQGSSNSGGTDDATFGDFNYRDVFKLDTYTSNQLVYNGFMNGEGGDPIAYDDPSSVTGGLRIYSFQELWQFTGMVTGYEKNLALGSTYETKENYLTAQSGHFWLYKPIYEEVPLDLTSTDWTVVNRPAGDLSITKAVTGSAASPSDEFTFTVRLTGDEDLVNQVNGTFGDMEFVGGMATVTLRGGETKTATNLPSGLSYAVTETALPGYEQVSAANDTGTIPVRSGVTASFTNNKDKETVPPEPPVTPAKPVPTPAKRAVPATGEPISAMPAIALAGMMLAGTALVLRRRFE